MEQATERHPMRYVWPALGAAVPLALLLMRRGRRPRSEEELLLGEVSIDLYSAMEKALKLVPGTPVEVELESEHEIPVWEVKVVPDNGGPVREVVIDARDGEVLEMRAEFEDETMGSLEETAA